jgi:TonB-linked SusC/RagA family outer membrane protein
MKRKAIYNFLLVALLTGWSVSSALAQNLAITGKVVSIDDNAPMSGVNIRVDGIAGVFEETDAEGRFSIQAPSYDVTLVFQYPGYRELHYFVGTVSELTFKMIPDARKSNLDEVVLSNGVKRQQRYVTQAVKALTEEDFTDRASGTMEGYLYGKVAGVNVTAVNGMLGAAYNVNIRGIGSITAGSQPLYIIDGMEINNLSYMTDWGSESFNTNLHTSLLVSLNVNDIESVTFLKDAAAKAVYGSRAANGVVVIETAKGEKGNSKIDFMINQGFDFKGPQFDVLNAEDNRQYLLEMALSQYGNTTDVTNRFDDYLFNNPYSDYYQDYNNATLWQKQVQNNTAYYGDYHFRIKGGDDVAKYTFSAGILDKNGILKNSSLTKINARFNLDYEVNEWMSIGTNLYFTKLDQKRLPMGFSRYNPLLTAYQKSPLTNPFAKEPDGRETPLYQDYDTFGLSNPIALVSAPSINELKNNQMGGKLFADFLFAEHFRVNLSLGLHNQSIEDRLFLPRHGIAPLRDMERISELTGTTDLIIDARAEVNYQNTFDNIHYVNVGVGGNYLVDQMEYTFGRTFNSAGDEYTRLNQGSDQDKSESGNEQWKMLAGYLRANYMLRERYIVDLTLRADGSSRFGEDKQVAFYPALGLAWRLGEEGFLRKDWLDELKVRASIGVSGNDNMGNYTSKLRFFPANYKYLGGIAMKQLANTELAPEHIREFDLGLDVSVFNQKLNFTLDFYDRTNRNLILPTILTLEQGVPFLMMNSGKLNNRGFEATLSSYLKTGDVNWNIGLTFAYNKNKVTELPGSAEYIESQHDIFTSRAIQGQPVGVYYGYQTAGVFATDADAAKWTNGSAYAYDPFRGGDVQFVNKNDDSVIDEKDMTYLGKAMPDMIGGFQLQVSWKGITLGGWVDTQWGREVVNGMRYKLESMQDYTNQSATVKDRWRRNGDVTDMPRLAYGDPAGNSRFSDRWVEDGSFIRLRSVSLSYDLPTRWVQKIMINKLKIFVNAENLLTYSKYLGFDPEFNHLNSDFLSGIDLGSMYIPRSLTFGIRVGL